MTTRKGDPDASKTPLAQTGFVARLTETTYTKPRINVSASLRAALEAERQETVRAFEAIGLGFWDWDLAAAEIWYSPYALVLVGYSREELTETTNFLQQLIHPDDLQLAYERQDAMLFGRVSEYRSEFRVRHRNGSWVWMGATGRIVSRAEDGTPLRAAGTFSDVSARKQEQADSAFLLDLRTRMLEISDPHALTAFSAHMLGEYLGVDRVAFALFDARRRVLATSGAWTKTGASRVPLEWKYDDFGEKFRHRTNWITPTAIDDVTSDPRTQEPETQKAMAAGGTAAVLFVPLVVLGEVEGVLAIDQATPRKWQAHEATLAGHVAEKLWDSVLRARAEQRRKSATEMLDMAMRMGRIGAFERDHLTQTTAISPGLPEILGYRPQTSGPDTLWIHGRQSYADYLARVHPEDRERLLTKLQAMLDPEQDGSLQDIHRIVTVDDEIRHVALVAHAEREIEGEVARLLRTHAIIQDITEAREQQLEAARAREQLLKNSRLSAMGTMASTLAHELNQPLAAAANFLSVIELELEGEAPVDKAQLLGIARRTNSKVLDAGRIIQSIRRFTIDGALGTTQVGLRGLVDKTLANLFDGPGSKGIAIINNVPRTLTAEIDPVQIEHVLANLVRNAANALEGQPHARVRITGTRKFNTVELRVADNGPGIADDVAGDLFSPFTTSKASGLGLGLPLCRTMVEAHGGKITLKCHGPDTGTTFLVTLPWKRCDA